MTGGGRRTQRWPEIWPDQRAELLRASHGIWQACIPAMVSLQTASGDYRAVNRLQAAALAFSTEISEGVSWIHGATTLPGTLPAVPSDRKSAVDDVLASCGDDPKAAIRTLLDVVERMREDQAALASDTLRLDAMPGSRSNDA